MLNAEDHLVTDAMAMPNTKSFMNMKEFHGPYFIAYWKDKKNHAKLRKKYLGKDDPRSSYLVDLVKKILKDDYCLALVKKYSNFNKCNST